MEDYVLIPATDFCKGHCVEIALIEQITHHGLIEVIYREDHLFIPDHEIKKLEKILVFHTDLQINLEGIETILPLLERVESMQEQITALENKLHRYL
jgi:hypothetical protein